MGRHDGRRRICPCAEGRRAVRRPSFATCSTAHASRTRFPTPVCLHPSALRCGPGTTGGQDERPRAARAPHRTPREAHNEPAPAEKATFSPPGRDKTQLTGEAPTQERLLVALDVAASTRGSIIRREKPQVRKRANGHPHALAHFADTA